MLLKQIIGQTILWNGAPLLFQEPDNGTPFTQNNGHLWKGRNAYYKNLPLPPLKGTTDISSSTSNSLYLPSEGLVWRITFDASLSNYSWQFITEGRFLNGYSLVSIHQRLLPSGAHIFDNTNSLFLFNATEYNIELVTNEKGIHFNCH